MKWDGMSKNIINKKFEFVLLFSKEEVYVTRNCRESLLLEKPKLLKVDMKWAQIEQPRS